MTPRARTPRQVIEPSHCQGLGKSSHHFSAIVPLGHSTDLLGKMRNSRTAKVLVLILGLTLPGCAAAETTAGTSDQTGSRFVDWDNLRPADSPNDWLLAPRDSKMPHFDQVSPVFDVAPDILAQAWQSVIADQPRTKIVAVSDDALRIEAMQESAIFGFVDLISARFSSLPENKSTIAVYSRSTVGYWDFGVNKRRVQDWLEVLGRRIAATK